MSIAKVRFWLIGVFGTVLMVAGLVVLAGLARETGSKMVVNALAGNSKAIGTAVRIQIERAFELGISLDELVGVDSVLEGELQRHRELSFFALVQKGAAGEPNAASDGGKVIAFVTRAKVTDAQRDEMKKLIIKPGDAELVSESYRATKMDVTDAQAMARQQAAAATEVVVPAAPQEAASSPVQPAAPQASVSQASLVIGYPVNYIDEQVNAVATDLIVAVLIALVLVTEFLRYASQHSTLREFFRFIEFTGQVKANNFGVRAGARSGDPMGALSLTLDERLNSIRQRYSGLLQRIERAPAHLQLGVKAELDKVAQVYRLRSDPTEVVSTADVARLRIGVFLVAMSEEICRPFFAVFASNLDGPVGLSPQLLAGIPLTTFLLVWALAQPIGASLLTRFGPNRCLTIAATVVSAGMLITAMTSNWTVLVAVRALTGGAYGGMFIFTLAMMLRHAGASGRAGAMAGFLSAVVAAGMCGPVIGGLIAGNFGFTAAFFTAAACSIASIGFVMGTADVVAAKKQVKEVSFAATLNSMRNAPLIFLMLFSTIPAKLVTTSVLLMLVPLTILDMGESPAVAGRLILLYFFGVFLVSGYIGTLSDRWNARKTFVTIGGLMSALACFIGYQLDSIWGLVVLCSLLGLGQAALASSQALLATGMMVTKDAKADRELALGIYRLIDRFGGAMGPIMAAVLIKQFGLRGALLGVGLIVGVGAVVAAVALWTYKDKDSTEEQESEESCETKVTA
jgi:MFS family permease